jgi:hypothetical protein
MIGGRLLLPAPVRTFVAVLAALAVTLFVATSNAAAGQGAWWRLDSHSAPTALEQGKEVQI